MVLELVSLLVLPLSNLFPLRRVSQLGLIDKGLSYGTLMSLPWQKVLWISCHLHLVPPRTRSRGVWFPEE